VEFWKNALWSYVTKLELFGPISGMQKRQSSWVEEHHLHGQTWTWSSLVMGVLFCCRKWKASLFEYQAILAKMVMPLELDDQWTFLQDSHPKVYIQIYLSLVQGWVVECSWVFRSKSYWTYLVEFEESSGNVNIISDLEAFSSEEADIAVERWQKLLSTYRQRLLEHIKNKRFCQNLGVQ